MVMFAPPSSCSIEATGLGFTERIVCDPSKRALDIAGALVGLAITLVLFPFIALAIWLDDSGPVFFSQTRVGLRGKPFRIWKFRSMVTNAEALKPFIRNEAVGCFFKNENDPRVTRVGAFLRKTSLDEFPQFFNVLLGDMSLVGTRPPTVNEVDTYKPHHWRRLDVKPGITGEWQVNGRSTVKNFEDVVALDLAYQQKWSLAYDIELLLETVLAVFGEEGAC